MFPLPRRWNGRITLVLAGAFLACCSPASALDEAGRCFRDKMRASRVAAAATFSCSVRGHGDAQRVAACLDKVRSRAAGQLAAAETRAGKNGFVCPAGIDSLALSARSNWPLRLRGESGDWGDDTCAKARVRAARRFASVAGRCTEKAGPGGQLVEDSCIGDARTRFIASWEETNADCDFLDAGAMLAKLEAELDESAARLEVRCGDGMVAGFEQCDDGATESDDGCSAECRREDCERVNGEVRCRACLEDAVADDDGCRCPDGFVGEPGSCVDVDECASGTVACPEDRPCVNLAGTWACAIPCTAQAFHDALATCGGPGGAIAFDCQNAVIAVPGGPSRAARDVSCDGLVIDGAGRGIAFELDPACWRTPLAAEQCPGGLEVDGTCHCPNVDSGDQFLLLRGDGNVVRDLTLRGFFEGIPVRGRGNLVENVRFERMCDDAFGSVLTGVGNVFRDLSVTQGCDKCSENGGVLADTDPDPRVVAHYNAVLENIDFDGCLTPVRVASSGRFRLRGLSMHAEDPEFPCDGPRFSSASDADTVVVRMEDSRIENCRHGLRFGRGTQAAVDGSRLASCLLRGLRLTSTAIASVQRTTIDGNGGGGSVEPGFGGAVAVGAQALLDLGGGSLAIDGALVKSAGGNSLCDNRAPDASRRDLESDPLVPATAAGNWWCSADPLADRVSGPATVDPLLDRAPAAFLAR